MGVKHPEPEIKYDSLKDYYMLHYYQNEIEESEIEEIKNLDLIGELRHQSKSDFFTDREVDQLELARETIIDIRWAIESQKAEYDEYQ